MRRSFCISIVLAALSILRVAFLEAGVQRIWAVGDGERIEKFDLRHPLQAANSVWDGEEISIFGARNEILAFQIIVESDAEGINSLAASLPSLIHRSGSSRIDYMSPEPDPTHYVGRPIQLFSVNYLYVANPTKASWIYRDGPGAPKDPTGWKPVQLVPENAIRGKGGFPLSVEPLQNQAIWIEVYTGRNRPAGIYDGTIQLAIDGKEYAIPLSLKIFNFNLSERGFPGAFGHDAGP